MLFFTSETDKMLENVMFCGLNGAKKNQLLALTNIPYFAANMAIF